MTLFSKFHPLLVHFPIALVLTSAVAELVAITTARQFWRTVAVANIRAGAVMGLVAAITGWLFASLPLMDTSTSVEWHRWLGTSGAAGAIGAAFLSATPGASSHRPAFLYRLTLFATAVLVAITGHLGGTLVWGARFFLP